jgi:hypothetical protein
MTVDTVELRSRTELLRSAALLVGRSPVACRDSSPDQFASTSLSKIVERATGADVDMGIGREADGESLRVSAASA